MLALPGTDGLKCAINGRICHTNDVEGYTTVARRPFGMIDPETEAQFTDPRFLELLDDIRHEKTPERLLKLARDLQQQLTAMKQSRTPN